MPELDPPYNRVAELIDCDPINKKKSSGQYGIIIFGV